VKVQEVSEDLGVRYVLEGSVQRAGQRIRVTAQLIDATKGHHLWAEQYDRDFQDLFALQDEITRKIMRAMQIKLIAGEQALLWRGTESIPAFEKLSQGSQLMRRLTKQDNAQARRLFEEAIALDSEYVMAYTLLGASYLYDVWRGWSRSPRQSLSQATEQVQKALSMDQTFDMAHSVLGHIYLVKGQYEEAISEGERAVELNPNGADAHARLGMSLYVAGRDQEAIALLNRAMRLNPHPPNWYLLHLGNAYRNAGKHEDAIHTYKKTLHRNPNLVSAHLGLASSYVLLGLEKEGRAAAEEALRISPKMNLMYLEKTIRYKDQAKKELILDAFRKAGIPETPPMSLSNKTTIAILFKKNELDFLSQLPPFIKGDRGVFIRGTYDNELEIYNTGYSLCSIHSALGMKV
jgi:adenylate cyclase